MNQLIFLEFCGRWGCTWQEGILNVFLSTFLSSGQGILILLGISLIVFLSPLFLLALTVEGFNNFLTSLRCQFDPKFAEAERERQFAEAEKERCQRNELIRIITSKVIDKVVDKSIDASWRSKIVRRITKKN